MLCCGEDGGSDQHCKSHGGHKYDKMHSDGLYSDSMARLVVREKDLVMICCPTMVRIKLKTNQFLPPNLSTWTVLRDTHSQESLSSNWRIMSSARRWRFR